MKIKKIKSSLTPLQKELVNHKLYSTIKSIDDLKIFTENHIYAVWDFMSLLKALQINLTCTSTPWLPPKNSTAARFINEIVLEEETDKIHTGKIISHFEYYIMAMKEIGANTNHIHSFLNGIKNSSSYIDYINESDLDKPIKEFLNFTFKTIETKQIHKIAAAFTFGREDLIPSMFIEIVKGINNKNNVTAEKFIYYLERHIELDGDDHGPIALKMIENLCGNSEEKWLDVKKISQKAIRMRIKLWDHILEILKKNGN